MTGHADYGHQLWLWCPRVHFKPPLHSLLQTPTTLLHMSTKIIVHSCVDTAFRCRDASLQRLVTDRQGGRLYRRLLFNLLCHFNVWCHPLGADCFLCHHECTMILWKMFVLLQQLPRQTNWDTESPHAGLPTADCICAQCYQALYLNVYSTALRLTWFALPSSIWWWAWPTWASPFLKWCIGY